MNRRSFLLSGTLLAVAAAVDAEAAPATTTFKVDGLVALRAYQTLVEEHLGDVLGAIKALAATTDAKSANWTAIKPALSVFAGNLTTAAAVWFAQPDGSYATAEAGPVSETLKDRAYFPTLLAGRDIENSLVISKSTGHRSIIVATPVVGAGRVVGIIGVSLRARLISKLVTERAQLPDDLTFYALTSQGETAIHRDPQRMFEYPSDLGDPSLKSAVTVILSQPQGEVDYDFNGTHRTAAFNKSDLTGWHFVLAKIHK